MRSSPPFCVKAASSSIIRRSPLHLIKDTSISMRLQDIISFLSSVNICGSWIAPVNNELCAMDVSGRIIAAFSSMARMLFFLSKRARSCSARSATVISSSSFSLVSLIIVEIIRFARATCEFTSPPLSATLSRPFSTTSAMYFASTLDASALSIGAVAESLSVEESSVSSPLLIICSYSPSFNILLSAFLFSSIILQYHP